MTKHSDASQLRLASASRRISAFLEQIAELKASSFPHQDGKSALLCIEAECEDARGRLNIPPGVDESLVDETCIHVASILSRYTEILGFILRSTNVRNPFELHFALKKLVGQAVGRDTKLLISSEWDFVPFTYPIGLDLLPGFVMVGSPAPESGNILLSPLAGHEIGHSAWRLYDFSSFLTGRVNAEVEASFGRHPDVERRLVEAQGLGALGRHIVADRCGEHAIQQLEEVFSDLFGLYVFGPAYVFAFDYFLAPGGDFRSLDYPSCNTRIKIMEQSANILNLDVDATLFSHWQPAVFDKKDEDILKIIDDVTKAIFPEMRKKLFSEISARGVNLPRKDIVVRALNSFERQEPLSEEGTLAEIVTAGWLYLKMKGGLYLHEQRDEYIILGDLMLKSIEVAEYLERLRGNA